MKRLLFLLLLLSTLSFKMTAQTPDTLSGATPLFVNEGETLIYHIGHDKDARQGTVSDALQNVPGVKVDTDPAGYSEYYGEADNEFKRFFTYLLSHTVKTVFEQTCCVRALWHLFVTLLNEVLQFRKEQEWILFFHVFISFLF